MKCRSVRPTSGSSSTIRVFTSQRTKPVLAMTPASSSDAMILAERVEGRKLGQQCEVRKRTCCGSDCNLTLQPMGEVCLKTGHWRSEEHTSELQSLRHLVCRL